MDNKVFLITGGLGFIGKHFITKCLEDGHTVINIDCYTYAADRKSSLEFKNNPNYSEAREYISNLGYLPICDYVVHFAAESHVDNSISNSKKFIETNINGTHHILELLKNIHPSHRPHLIHISTDEVYGDSSYEHFKEENILKPSSPYSASKAAADQLVMSYGRTYDIKYNIIRMTNCFGHNQYPEKLIPTICLNLYKSTDIPVHGDGSYIRTWLHVTDAVSGILTVIESGKPNEIYNIAGDWALTNIQVVNLFIKVANKENSSKIKFVENRKGQDIAYKVNDKKLRTLGWFPKIMIINEAINIYNSFDPRRFTTKT